MSAQCPVRVECVAKLYAALRTSNYQIRLNGFLNQCCAAVLVRKSILLILVGHSCFRTPGARSSRFSDRSEQRRVLQRFRQRRIAPSPIRIRVWTIEPSARGEGSCCIGAARGETPVAAFTSSLVKQPYSQTAQLVPTRVSPLADSQIKAVRHAAHTSWSRRWPSPWRRLANPPSNSGLTTQDALGRNPTVDLQEVERAEEQPIVVGPALELVEIRHAVSPAKPPHHRSKPMLH